MTQPSEDAVNEMIKKLAQADVCTCTDRQGYIAGQHFTIKATTSEADCLCCSPKESNNE